ncbi:MAG: ABC transporter ATP-binding protein [Oscillospiraceae bacterium]|nr:ABC transporter ATP-binding protein [Oscillospiraceae bacterium]
MEEILVVQKLTKVFGGVVACKDLSFCVKQGEIKGLIGPNGAGKTTAFNLITGVIPPTSGSILFMGEELSGMKPHVIVKRGIVRTFQNIRLFQNLTVLENVIIALDQQNSNYSVGASILRLPGMKREERRVREAAMDYLRVMNLEQRADQTSSSLPYGLQRKLEIARALASQPKLLLLDEPAAGMNPEESRELARLIQKIRDDYHLSIILIDHHMDVIMDLCDSIAVINFGEKIAEGTPEEIQRNPDVLQAYLGEGYKRAKS